MSDQELKRTPQRRRGPMGHGRMQPGEKPKNFKKSIKKLIQYIAKF